MKTKKRTVSNAKNIGQQITKNDFQLLKENYQKLYGEETQLIIPKDLIQKSLNLSEHVSGIRFMYGLKDTLNPYSKVLFLIPCSDLSHNLSTEAMLVEKGYYDHKGNLYSVQDVLLCMSQYVQHVSNNHTEFTYKEITRGNFYGKNSLESLLTTDCHFIEYTLGYLENHVSPIINSLDKNYKLINEVYMDFSEPCPNTCDNQLCTTALAVETYGSNESELNQYRAFRDQHLLHLEGGSQLFEMYYFVSPVVAKILNSSKNKDAALQQFYVEEIVPFKQLLEAGNHQEAVNSLRNTLYSLFEEYEYSKLFL